MEARACQGGAGPSQGAARSAESARTCQFSTDLDIRFSLARRSGSRAPTETGPKRPILHGAENAPGRERRDHLGCLELALREGVALPRRAIGFSGREDVTAFLEDWAERCPGQVV